MMRSDRRGFLAMLGGAFAAAAAAIRGAATEPPGVDVWTYDGSQQGNVLVSVAPGYFRARAGESLRVGDFVQVASDGRVYRCYPHQLLNGETQSPLGVVMGAPGDVHRAGSSVLVSYDVHLT